MHDFCVVLKLNACCIRLQKELGLSEMRLIKSNSVTASHI